MIIVNFKNYLYDKKSLRLAQLIEKYLPKAIVAASAIDIGYLSYYTKLQIYAQHVDMPEGKRATGFLLPETIKSHGGIGTLLNHSEHRLPFDVIKKTISRVHTAGLKVVLCCETLKEAEKFKELKPFAIAFEDSKLVGSGKSITNYRADDVEKFGKMFAKEKIIPLCGAGVGSAADVLKARELGCKGVLISSAIAAASEKHAEKLLKEISITEKFK